jgi:hypothetical protein
MQKQHGAPLQALVFVSIDAIEDGQPLAHPRPGFRRYRVLGENALLAPAA